MTIMDLEPFREYDAIKLRSATAPHGDSIRLKRPIGTVYKPATHLYLIYISIDNVGLVVRHFFEKLTSTPVEDVEDNFIREARKGNSMANMLPLIVFKDPSYFTLVVDKENWDFYYPNPNSEEPDHKHTHDPLVFLESKSFLVEYPEGSGHWIKITQDFDRNRAFYNAKRVVRSVDGDETIRVRCNNFLTKNAAGDPLGLNEDQDFGFNILVRVPFSADPTEKVTLIIDPDGQNQGPRTLRQGGIAKRRQAA